MGLHDHLTQLNLGSMTLEQLIGPGSAPEDLNPADFDKLYKQGSEIAVRRAVAFIAPQDTCSRIIQAHGPMGLKRVLSGIARAASTRKVPMNARVRAQAAIMGLEVF